MTSEHRRWIDDYCARGSTQGHCAEATTEMQRAFPDLRRVRGHVVLAGVMREIPHWWLEAPSGEVLDPTADQFHAVLAYIPHEGPEPSGKCPNCGEYIYGGGSVCSDRCGQQYAAYCLGGS